MEKTTTSMSRAEFLRNLGLSGAALMSMYCMGGLTACTNKREEPQPINNPGPQKLDFTLDLTAPANSNLNNNGGFIYKDNIIIARTSAGAYVALSKACTHQGATVTFVGSNDEFHCPAHGSDFNLTGAVTQGPATSPLKQYQTSLTGNSLRVFESS